MTQALQTIVPGLMMGMAGSLHCIGMCGPLALGLGGSGRERWAGTLLMQSGRVATYALLGLALGWMGGRVAWFGLQQRLSIGLGTVILLSLLMHRKGTPLQGRLMRGGFFKGVRRRMAGLIFREDAGARFMTGVLNGLLPCGLVLMALGGAAVTGDPLSGMAFMTGFGAGTLPAMLAMGLFGGFAGRRLRARISGAYPGILAVMAVLLILRGLNLGIPLLSPAMNAGAAAPAACHPG